MRLAKLVEPFTGVEYHPHYWSTYCIHHNHADCRRACKTCHAPCLCPCHRSVQDDREAS